MLHKVELLVAGAGPEVISHDQLDSRSWRPSSVMTVMPLLRPKGGFVSTMSKCSPGSLAGYPSHDWVMPLFIATDAMQKEIHHTKTRRIIDNLPAVQCFVFQKAFLLTIEWLM